MTSLGSAALVPGRVAQGTRAPRPVASVPALHAAGNSRLARMPGPRRPERPSSQFPGARFMRRVICVLFPPRVGATLVCS